ncbi:MAG: AAA family ATPase [Tabrizicola sp.]
MPRRILITGCSGGGKSTLLAALAARGHATVPEPGRRIVAGELASGGRALPWVDPLAFTHRALEMARDDLAHATGEPVFFDRGLIDAAVALHVQTGKPVAETLGGPSPYDDPVFLAPPWPEIYRTDPERRHGQEEAVAEYDRIVDALAGLRHRVLLLPRIPVEARCDYVIGAL